MSERTPSDTRPLVGPPGSPPTKDAGASSITPPSGNGREEKGIVAWVQRQLNERTWFDGFRRVLGTICFALALFCPVYIGWWVMHGDGQTMPWCEPDEYLWRPWARIALTASSLLFSAGLARTGERLFYRLVTLENPEWIKSHAAKGSDDATPELVKALAEYTTTLSDTTKTLVDVLKTSRE